MLSTAFLILPAALRLVAAASSNSSTACNNSPNLCNRPYNNVTHLGSHDSPFVANSSNGYTISGNQYYNSTVQLAAGVRLLSAQVQTSSDNGALHVCHSSCDLYDAGTLSSWLSEINTWLMSNANEVVTVLLVNGADASASELAVEYEAANISNIAYTPISSNATASEWPTLQSMIDDGTRMINFVASLSDNTDATYLMSEFDHIFENDYDITSPAECSCIANRPSSVENDTASALSQGMMPLMNHFLYEASGFGIQYPNSSYVNTTNAPSGGVGNLGSAAEDCTTAYGQAPTFVLVDFFNVGPAIETVDRLNGITNAVGRTTVSTAVASDSTSGAPAILLPHAAMLCLTILAVLFVIT